MKTAIKTEVKIIEGSIPDTPKDINHHNEETSWDEVFRCDESLTYLEEWLHYHYTYLGSFIEEHAKNTDKKQVWRCTQTIHIQEFITGRSRKLDIQQVTITCDPGGNPRESIITYPLTIARGNALVGLLTASESDL